MDETDLASWWPIVTGPSMSKRTAILATVLLMLSMLAVAVAPSLMPESYSWVEHSISESGAQGIDMGWVARSGFLLAGFAVLLLAGVARDLWGFWGTMAFRLYGVAVIFAGTFAHGPWEEVPFDRLEGFLHTAAAFFTGLGFVTGVYAVNRRRAGHSRLSRAYDWLTIVAVLVIPVTMLIFTGHTGIQQRFLALLGYVWLLTEGLRLYRPLASRV